VIEARDVAYRYPDGTVGLDGVDFELAAGERVGVTGPNGSGKSTLMLVLGGLLSPSRGTVEFYGSPDVGPVRDRIGVLLQDPDDYLFNTTVREDIEYGPAQIGHSRERADATVERLADRLELHGLLEKPPFRLSGGEKKRAALAAVLALEPDVLLVDEPLGTVDARHGRTMLDLLDELHREDGLTVVTFTPDVELLADVADRTCVVGPEGRLRADAPTREVVTDADLLAGAGLEPPAVVRLFDGLGLPREDLPVTVAEARELLDDRAVEARDA
jgi:cobalt/nickel transport system ATP-binding protein